MEMVRRTHVPGKDSKVNELHINPDKGRLNLCQPGMDRLL